MRFPNSHFVESTTIVSTAQQTILWSVGDNDGRWMVCWILRVRMYIYRMPFKCNAAPHSAAIVHIAPESRGRKKLRMKNAFLPRVTYHHRVAGTTIFFNVCIFQRFWCYCPRDLRPDSRSFSWKSSGKSLFARFCTGVNKPCWCNPIACILHYTHTRKKRRRR